MNRFYPIFFALFFLSTGCSAPKSTDSTSTTGTVPFYWENANIYFLLTDRFNNGNPENDMNFDRSAESGKLRGFMGGDLQGITQKIEEGYFTDLGITAIWFTPVVEQIHGQVDEGTGPTYGYHGYWAKDWTVLDPNFGTEEDLAKLIETAHSRRIRILLDVVVNHPGPVTAKDPVWGDAWVRTGPKCVYQSFESTVECTLVENLPDVRTDSNTEVELPDFLRKKWEAEGRLNEELAELDAFFKRTGHPRAPRFYIMKWLTDYVRKYGVDGFRFDTMKHTEATVWSELSNEARAAFREWKVANPDKVLDDNDFFTIGEVYGYGASNGRDYDYGDRKVDFFAEGVTGLINFEFKGDANWDYEAIFSKYANQLNGPLQGKTVMNYISSHDDVHPFDQQRQRPIEAGTKLLLCPGQSQVYYGDETVRTLDIPGTQGDATLRSFMNWAEIRDNAERVGIRVQGVLAHWQKLGQFRRAHPSVGAGKHLMISEKPYVFQRTFTSGTITDAVVVGLDLPKGKKEIPVGGAFVEGDELLDSYSGQTVKVVEGKVAMDSPFDLVLLGKK